MALGDGGWLDRMAKEYGDFLPQAGMMPRLSPGEVARFVALGEEGRNRFRAGDRAGAESAYRSQLRIFSANPEPYVSLALIAAAEGRDAIAIDHLRSAVIRGFTDLRAVERAEVWGKLSKKMEYLTLQDAIPVLQEIEREWGGWSAFRATTAPEHPDEVLRDHAVTTAILEGMCPALGARLTRLWIRAVDRATAAGLEAYVAAEPDAPQALEAARRLMAIYAGGPAIRWGMAPREVASRLQRVAEFLLDRSSEGSLHSGALVCRALSAYSTRDEEGNISPSAGETIRESLEEVLASASEPAFLALAVEGLVRTDMETGARTRASKRFRAFLEAHGEDRALVDRVRDHLGTLALWAGGLPPIRATALDGSTVDARLLEGKVVVVEFWATWCRPCIEEFGTLRRIAERHGDEVILVGINLDHEDELTEDALRTWVAGRNMPGVQIHDGRSFESDLVRAFGVREIPFTVVAAPDGAILAVSERGKGLEKAVNEGLAIATTR